MYVSIRFFIFLYGNWRRRSFEENRTFLFFPISICLEKNDTLCSRAHSPTSLTASGESKIQEYVFMLKIHLTGATMFIETIRNTPKVSPVERVREMEKKE